MSNVDKYRYYASRAAEEAEKAKRTPHKAARAVHLEMASRYQELAEINAQMSGAKETDAPAAPIHVVR